MKISSVVERLLDTQRTSQTREAPDTGPNLWRAPPKAVLLADNEVHVWRALLDLDAREVEDLWQTLTADEQARARRYHFQKDSERFIVGRGFLRTILGRYLDIKPEHLRFCYNPHGKPTLAGESGKYPGARDC